MILVERLYFNGIHSADQVLLNPLQPSTKKYYLDSVKRMVDLGIFEFRVDLGHLLLH